MMTTEMQKKTTPKLHQDWIDRDAYDIVVKLQKAGYTTYLVGGCVRDLLAGFHPKDFDIATNAVPQQVKKKIYNSYVIGRRFRLVLVKRGDKQFEVATFRRNVRDDDLHEDGEAPAGDNLFGTVEEDAQRRDFTINALFYDPVQNEVIDHINGLQDINQRILRVIGDPDARLIEDPIRILRAIRLAHKLNFTIEESLRASIQKNAASMVAAVLPRKREEYLKILKLDEPSRLFLKLYDLNLMQYTLPSLLPIYQSSEAREIFQYYLDQNKQFISPGPDQVPLITLFLLAYVRALNLNLSEWSEQEDIPFLREEFGVHKQELFLALRSLQFQKSIKDIEYFRRKGGRRQFAFIKQDCFPLALQIAEFDYLLTPQEILFWKNQIRSVEDPAQQNHYNS